MNEEWKEYLNEKYGRAMAQGSIPGQSMWDLWWTKLNWDRFLPEYFGSPLSISFHRCSITRKNEETDHLSLHLHHRVAQ
jgi:hypothetical protein